jgi:cell division transport system ATP-binding protein
MLQKKKTEDVIVFNKVSLSFGAENHVFSNLDLAIPKGSFHFLTGPSGAGKSTFLKMLYLSQQQTTGSVSLFSRNTLHINHSEVPHIRRKIGVVFQDFRLIPSLNALDNVALPLRVRGVETRKARKQAAELLQWVGLEDAMYRTPLTLSGGQQQRVAIARAVIGRPQILLADEPTGNVDDGIALKLLHLFEELHKIGTTVIVATHNRSLPHAFHHPEIFLDQGKASLILPSNHAE